MSARCRQPGLAGRLIALACAVGLLGVAACSLSDLGSQGAIMSIVPSQLADSASAGDTTPRVLTLDIANQGGGELRWQAQLTTPAAWLSLQPGSGIAPSVIQVRADPAGLAIGDYRDTVIVFSSSASGAAAIPLDFRIVP
jgi:Viral BACON domain